MQQARQIRRRGLAALLLLALPAGVNGQEAAAPPAAPAPAATAAPGAVAAAPATPAAPKATAPAGPSAPAAKATPNAQRVLVLGAIDKRTGLAQNFSVNPGKSVRFGALRVTVRTCEVTSPWEQKLTGAFLLIDELPVVNGRANEAVRGKRVYSGWMFAESPSLHPLEHPRYDVWVKSCAMRFPETGPNTVAVGSAPRSSAKTSATTSSAAPN